MIQQTEFCKCDIFFLILRQPGKVGLNFGFEVVKELFNGRENIVGKKIVNLDSVKKAINDEDVTDDTLPYAGYKVWSLYFFFSFNYLRFSLMREFDRYS